MAERKKGGGGAKKGGKPPGGPKRVGTGGGAKQRIEARAGRVSRGRGAEGGPKRVSRDDRMSRERPPRREWPEGRAPRDREEGRPRPSRQDERPARGGADRPARDFSDDRPARRFAGERPARGSTGDRPTRSYTGDRPARNYGGDRPPRPPAGDGPARGRQEDRPAWGREGAARPARGPQGRFVRSTRDDARPPRDDRPARGPQGRPFRAGSDERPPRSWRDDDRRPSPAAPPPSPATGTLPAQEMIYGKHAVLAALEAEQPLHKLWVSSGRHTDAVVTQILELAAKQGVVVQRCERDQLDRLGGPNARHNGVLATIAAAHYAEVEDILAAPGEAFVLLLDGVSDPHNLGALIRTAEAAGVAGVVVTERRSAGLTGAAAKASAGAAARVPVARVVNLARTIDELKQKGVWIVGLDADDGEDYTDANLGGPLAIVVGGEGEGLHRLVRERCDFVVRIPMRGKIASLNASVAGALVMYEARRQRALAGVEEEQEETDELVEEEETANVDAILAEDDEDEDDEALLEDTRDDESGESE